MVLGLEIATLVIGIMFLARGKGVGKGAVAHPQYRWLGGVLITCLPVVFTCAMIFGVYWAITHQGQSDEQIEDALKIPLTIMEVAIVAAYVVMAILWEKSIKKKAGPPLS